MKNVLSAAAMIAEGIEDTQPVRVRYRNRYRLACRAIARHAQMRACYDLIAGTPYWDKWDTVMTIEASLRKRFWVTYPHASLGYPLRPGIENAINRAKSPVEINEETIMNILKGGIATLQ